MMEPTMRETMTKWEIAKMVERRGRHVLVLRGVSGAGKSTLAQFLYKALEGAATIVSADQFFTDEAGVYRFNAALLPNAHATCLRDFVRAVQSAPAWNPADPMGPTSHVVIVDNTNTTIAEAAPYMALAAAYGWTPTLVDVTASVEEAAPRNQHGVSVDTIHAQLARMTWMTAALPQYWRRAWLDP